MGPEVGGFKPSVRLRTGHGLLRQLAVWTRPIGVAMAVERSGRRDGATRARPRSAPNVRALRSAPMVPGQFAGKTGYIAFFESLISFLAGAGGCASVPISRMGPVDALLPQRHQPWRIRRGPQCGRGDGLRSNPKCNVTPLAGGLGAHNRDDIT